MRGRFGLCLIGIALLVQAGWTAEKPVLDSIFPAGAQRGSTNAVTLFGKFEPWPPGAWSTCKELQFKFSTNKGSIEIVVPENAAAGAHLLRIFNNEGASEPCIFVVSDHRELEEKEPNNLFSKPQLIAGLPVTLNGRLASNGDVDSFRLEMKAGDWLDARVDAYTLMSKLDPVLRLIDTNGYQLAWNHDFETLDPRLIWRAPRDSSVVLQIFGFAYPANSEIQLSGGSDAVYRLYLATANHAPQDLSQPLTELEPNNLGTNAPTLNIPGEITGSICPAGDEDRFRIHMAKDAQIEVSVASSPFGSALDPWVRIEDSGGKELVRNDDANNSRNADLQWKAPSEGNFIIAIGSVTHQGSEDFRYRLRVKSLAPEYRATVSASAFVLSSGSTNEIKFNLKRLRGFTNDLAASLHGLPDGVSVGTVKVPEKDGEGVIPLITKTNASAFNGPIEIVLADHAANRELPIPFELVSRSENNGVPGGYTKLLVESVTDLWLTLKAPAAAAESK